MVTGLLSPSNLSGPITIARVAEASVTSGFEDFVRFLAYLSVSLGILNLLPVPVLDGGHIVYYTIEAIRKTALGWGSSPWITNWYGNDSYINGVCSLQRPDAVVRIAGSLRALTRRNN